ncbi:MAG: portal protein [Pseudomonadota bacterium]
MTDEPVNAVRDVRLDVAALISARAEWEPHWRDVERMILPRRGRWLTNRKDKQGDYLNRDILDATGTYASRTLTAGLMTGMTSPMRKWFSLRHPRPEVMSKRAVKVWIHEVTEVLRRLMASSNLYRTLPQVYAESSGFGTGAMSQHEGKGRGVFKRNWVSRAYTVGEYAIASDHNGDVSTFVRKSPITAAQIESMFPDSVPNRVDRALKAGQRHVSWELVHYVAPMREPLADKWPEVAGRRFFSLYYLGESLGNHNYGAQYANEPELEVGGYSRFPFNVFRWSLRAGDDWGRGVGMEALPDVKQLQALTRQYQAAVALSVKRPMQAPDSVRESGGVNAVPGGMTYYSDRSRNAAPIQPLYEVDPDHQAVLMVIQDLRQRIDRAFYADLFLASLGEQRSNITAREIEERSQEKLMALGDAYQRAQDELLRPVVENAFRLAVQLDLLPPPPPELQGQELEIQFASILEESIQAIEQVAYDRYAGGLTVFQQLLQRPIEEIDWMKVIDHYTRVSGIDPDVMRDPEAVAQDQRARADAQLQQVQTEQTAQLAGAARDASQVQVSGRNLAELAVDATAN